jgi:small subunit ribosomal protein S7
MIKLARDHKDLKNKVLNTLMLSGKKTTCEKVVLKSVKRLQKSTMKKSRNLIQLAVINSTPTFKLNEQAVKKGKRKATKDVPSFILSDSLRIMMSLKFLKEVASKNRGSVDFYQSLAKEVLSSSFYKSQSVDKKNELQKQVLVNKRYLSQFRW